MEEIQKLIASFGDSLKNSDLYAIEETTKVALLHSMPIEVVNTSYTNLELEEILIVNTHFKNIRILSSKFIEVSFVNCTFNNVEIYNSEVSNCFFDSCIFNKCIFHKTKLLKNTTMASTFESCKYLHLKIKYALALKINLINSVIKHVEVDHSIMSLCDLNQSNVSYMTGIDNNIFFKCKNIPFLIKYTLDKAVLRHLREKNNKSKTREELEEGLISKIEEEWDEEDSEDDLEYNL